RGVPQRPARRLRDRMAGGRRGLFARRPPGGAPDHARRRRPRRGAARHRPARQGDPGQGMNILAVDTTGESLSVALRAGAKTHSVHKLFAKPHDETLLPQVTRLLEKAGLAARDLDAIAAANG